MGIILELSKIQAEMLLVLMLLICQQLIVSSQGPESYFNGTSYVSLYTTLNVRGRTSFSFRTCSDGKLLYQEGSFGDFIDLSLLPSGVLELKWQVNRYRSAVHIGTDLINNHWHDVDLIHYLGSVTLSIGSQSVLVANSSYHSDFFDLRLDSSHPLLTVGRNFTGCILQGAGVVLNVTSMQSSGVTWGKCPLPDRGDCDGYQVDHCFALPCNKFSKCVSLESEYSCLCTSRYTGQNCDIDMGPLCEKPEFNRCQNSGVCQEDRTGNFTTCACLPRFTGTYCETMIDNSFCDTQPCRNGGTCNINQFRDSYVCTCPLGFAGVDCELNIDECQSSPCQNNGSCTDEINSYTCDCSSTGYRGPNCEVNINECEENNPCYTGSACFDRYGDYICDCPPGFGGKNCDEEVNECDSSPCQNAGTCINNLSGYLCDCIHGFAGVNCEENVDDCFGVSCPNNSHCIDGINSFTCVCNPGFAGAIPHCFEIDECASGPCSNGGTCRDQLNGFFCTCPNGFSGNHCEENIDDCLSQPCTNGGTCVDGIGNYTCECSPGYSGLYCEVDINDCIPNPCKNSFQCIDEVNDYSCECLPGWEGKNCVENIDECRFNPCLHGQCMDLPNNYSCSCDPGYTGKRCEENINDCDINPCLNGGICEDLIADFSCECPESFMGKTCSEVYDACHSAPCDNGGTCWTNAPSHQFTCLCPAGFSGERCETDIDECIGVVCPFGQTCFDLVNTYKCGCPIGFSGPECGININECSSNPCVNGSCVDGIGTYACQCPSGLTGRHCETDIDECLESPCKNGICQNFLGSFSCYCRPGFTGEFCNIEFNECLSSPCRNGATCNDLINDYNCSCIPGFSGRNCETDIDECASSPCQNGGTCNDLVNRYECQCVIGFAGTNCETNIDDCASQPCYNNGVCIDRINGFTCNCDDSGFTGMFCETNIDDCLPNPCQNGALCKDRIKDYNCSCYYGYDGKNCEIDIPECNASPCLNNALCLENSNRTLYDMNYPGFTSPFSYESAGGYKCICQLGFAGIDCETNINDCEGHNCVNGTCIDGINYYNCDCDPGYESQFCDLEINECKTLKPCKNGASCIDLIADYECNCLPLYGDKNCSTRLLGCENQQCRNDAMCDPYLDEYGEHSYKCLCPQGFYGNLCELSTTVSFNTDGYWTIDPQAIQTYALELHFRTTLSSGVIAQGFVFQPPLQYILYLWNGSIRLDVYKRLVKVIELLSTKSGLNDSFWKFLQVRFEPDIVTLNVSGRVEYAAASLSPLDFTTRLGSVSSQFLPDNKTIPYFVGCMQDVWVSGNIMIPDFSGPLIHNVEAGCRRIDQCGNSPCVNGLCQDMWSDYQCICSRPYFGDRCEYSHKPATFGYKTLESYAKMQIPVTIRQNFQNTVGVSLFLRTRKATGLIFYLGTSLSDHNVYAEASVPNSTFIVARLQHGVLQVLLKLQHENPVELNLRKSLNDGNYHFIEVSRNYGKLEVKVNGTGEMISVSNVPFYAEEVYLAGLPQLVRQKRQAQADFSYLNSGVDSYSFENLTHFKGIIQDFRLNNEIVEFYPLNVEKGMSRSPIPVVISRAELYNVTEGELSDNLCDPISPCEQNSKCNDIWNEYLCICSKGFRGKNCGEPEPCSNNTCPEGSMCENLEVGYECLSDAAFDGKQNFAQYKIQSLASNIRSIQFRFRSQNNGTIMYVQSINNTKYFLLVEKISDSIEVRWHFGPNESSVYEKIVSGISEMDGGWHKVKILFKENLVYLYTSGGKENPQLSEDNYTSGLNELFNDGAQVYLGYNPKHNKYFKGCLNEVRIEGILLPFVDFKSPFETVNIKNISHGCTLCWDDDCRKGSCENKTDSYKCNCPEGYKGHFCEIDICVSDNPCENGGTCSHIDDNILCNCSLDFTGDRCEKLNRCHPDPCVNGGSCSPSYDEDDFNCICSENYGGKNCSIVKTVTCGNDPCIKGSCVEDLNATNVFKYKCKCETGYEGQNCSDIIDFCKSKPCLHKGRCEPITDRATYQCNCEQGFEGSHCEIVVNSPCDKGIFINGTTDIICKCYPGYKGSICAEKIRTCTDDNIVCYNGACTNDEQGSYICECQDGYFGKHCNVFNECDDSKCNDKGECYPSHDITERYFEYNCSCVYGYVGKSCNKKVAITGSDDDSNLVIIILIPVMCIFILCLLIGAIVFLRMAKKKRATRGTYSPSRQEMFGSRVEMNHVMKPPPEERLI